ncbi:MAG TPA: hypothetical protein VGN95_13035 [Pyrinomonadaceae bacterium]|jgi:hypothetical protein|nr:hypothetical protein [Pyrinomonadaceae bacterium]
MDEQAITRAAEEAVNDLQLDCKINKVCRSPRGDQWCVQFSGKYGQFCDDLKNQFGKENSARVVQEKIKGHLLKQVTKIRSNTGKTRRPRINPSDEGQMQSTIMSAPLKMIEDAFNRASQIAGEVVGQVAGVAGAARETVANVAESISPVTIEIRSDSIATAKESRNPSTRKYTKAAKATSHTSTKKTRSVSREGSKKAKKTGKLAARVSKAKKAATKRSKKNVRRVSR